MKTAVVYAALGAAAFLAWRWWHEQQFKASIGQRAYDSLNALQPTITAPVIRVPLPTLRL